MIDRWAQYRYRNDVVVIPRIRVTFAMSILIHVAALWILLPKLPLMLPGPDDAKITDRLQVQLDLPTQPVPAQAAAPTPPARETRQILTARARRRRRSWCVGRNLFRPLPHAPPRRRAPSLRRRIRQSRAISPRSSRHGG